LGEFAVLGFWTVVKWAAIILAIYGAYDSFRRWRAKGSKWDLYRALFLAIGGLIWAVGIIFNL
jgi:hypothetical protein